MTVDVRRRDKPAPLSVRVTLARIEAQWPASGTLPLTADFPTVKWWNS